jgi:hypothetical protein
MIRTYSELLEFDTLEDRYEYLRLGGMVGDETFGFDRWMNQQFYRSREWRHVRDEVIVRDNGFDLGIADVPIRGAPAIHHLKPLTPDDIEEATIYLLDPEYLISTSQRTHNAIHFGDARQLPRPWVERRPGDTRLWGR